jgi:hypothetical protein
MLTEPEVLAPVAPRGPVRMAGHSLDTTGRAFLLRRSRSTVSSKKWGIVSTECVEGLRPVSRGGKPNAKFVSNGNTFGELPGLPHHPVEVPPPRWPCANGGRLTELDG